MVSRGSPISPKTNNYEKEDVTRDGTVQNSQFSSRILRYKQGILQNI